MSVEAFLATVGSNEKQWKENMKIEHCDIDPGDPKSTAWGASDRQWTTGNYGAKKTTSKFKQHFEKYFLPSAAGGCVSRDSG